MGALAKLIALAVCLTLITKIVLVDCKSSVDIVNEVGQPFWLRCQSGDDDLGWNLLQPNQHYHFEFRTNVWRSTLFWCAFRWGALHQAFEVWNHNLPDQHIMSNDEYPRKKMPVLCGQCGWKADTWGFYFWDKDSQSWKVYKPWLKQGCPPCESVLEEDMTPIEAALFGNLSNAKLLSGGVSDISVSIAENYNNSNSANVWKPPM